MKNKLIAITVLALSTRMVALAADPADTSYTGATYALPAGGHSLFAVERRWTTGADKKTLIEAFKDHAGTMAATLETNYKGGKLESIRFEQKQTGETARAEFKDGRIFYSSTINGKTKESNEGVSGDWVAFNAVPEHIVKHWATLAGGKTVTFRIPIPVMRDSFGFSLSKTKSWVEDGKPRTEFKLESSNAVIRMLADPMFYVLDDGDKSLIEYRGRTMVKNGGKDLDATVKYNLQKP